MGIRFPFGKGGKPRSPFTGGNSFGKIKDTVKKEVLDEIKREAIAPLKKEVEDLKRDAEKIAKKAATDVFNEITDAFSREAVKQLLKWIEAFQPKTAWINLNGVKLNFDVEDKIDDIKSLVNSRPKGKSGVVRIVKTVAPTSIDLSASVAFALGVTSDNFGVSGGVDGISPQRFLDRVDSVL